MTPIVYGGLAYFYYTKDENIAINDLDLLVPESKFTELIKLLNKQKNLVYKKMPYHSIEVFDKDFKIDLDSIEYFLDPRSRTTHKIQIDNLEFNILNTEALIDIYEKALKGIPNIIKFDKKRKNYIKKLKNLKKVCE